MTNINTQLTALGDKASRLWQQSASQVSDDLINDFNTRYIGAYAKSSADLLYLQNNFSVETSPISSYNYNLRNIQVSDSSNQTNKNRTNNTQNNLNSHFTHKNEQTYTNSFSLTSGDYPRDNLSNYTFEIIRSNGEKLELEYPIVNHNNNRTFTPNLQNKSDLFSTGEEYKNFSFNYVPTNEIKTEIKTNSITIEGENSEFTSIGTTPLDLPHLTEADVNFYLFHGTGLDTTQETYIITHGWRSMGVSESNWTNLASSIKNYNQNANIIFADWSNIASNLNYRQAAEDTETVGNAIAQFLYNKGVNPTQTTAIGHSLGAHVSGNIGEKFDQLTAQSLHMIIGLDPAGPDFEDIYNSKTSLRLDETDADRVVAFHSTATLGYDNSLGDVDFYLNDWNDFNRHQPGQKDFIADHAYPIEVLTDLYQGNHYNQPDGTVFDYNDVLNIGIGRYNLNTTSVT
ncbi:MAG: hypothetical protein AAF378_03595 [Cyanobacteria bacterium P01_A01_bin.84]